MVFLLAGVVGEDVDAAVAFGHVDHAAAVDQDVLGLWTSLAGIGPRRSLGSSGMKNPVMCGSWRSLMS
jgi:hypothetical protein